MKRGVITAFFSVVFLLGAPVWAELSSTFESDSGEWRFLNDVKDYGWTADVGNPAGAIQGVDITTGEVWYFQTPESWSGDWSSYTHLSYEINMLVDNGSYFRESADGDVKIVGTNGQSMQWNGAQIHTLNTWHAFEVPLSANSFDVSQSTFDSIMQDVDSMWIRGEFISGGDTEALDNVRVYTSSTTSGDSTAEAELRLHYLFAGDLKDSSGNQYDASVIGDESTVDYGSDGPGDYQFLELAGSSDNVISFPCAVMNGLQNFAFAFWLKTTDTGDRYVVSVATDSSDNYFVVGMDNETLSVHLNGSGNTFSSNEVGALSGGTWRHVVITRYYEMVRVYVDGIKLGEGVYNYADAMDTTDGGCLIGQEQDQVLGGLNASQSFIGGIADFRVYSGDVGLEYAQNLYQDGEITSDDSTSSSDTVCAQVITYAENPLDGMCVKFADSCTPEGWSSCTESDYTGSQSGSCAVGASSIQALGSGWSLVGTGGLVDDFGIFDSAEVLWSYQDGSWKKYTHGETSLTPPSFTLEAFDGFWIRK